MVFKKTLCLVGMMVCLWLTSLVGANEPSWPQVPGLYKQSLNLPDGRILRYTLSIPREYSPQEVIPLVLALHYGGPVTPWYSHGFMSLLIAPAFEDLKTIIIAPDCPGKNWLDHSSESAVLALLQAIQQGYAINIKRLAVTGFSMGGVGTWHFAAKFPDKFCAAIAVSAQPEPQSVLSMGNTPLYLIHSRRDEIFPLAPLRAAVKEMKKRAILVRLVVLNDLSHYKTASFVPPLRKAVHWLKKMWTNS